MDSEEENPHYSIGGEEDDNYTRGSDGEEKVAEDGGNKEKHYKILKEEDIRQLQDNDISTVSSLLSISRGLACTLLCRKNWDLNSFYDGCFADDEITFEPVGILRKRKFLEQVCKICYEEMKNENTVSAACGHPFCADCWKTYITTLINDGPGCLTLHCPEPACKATVGLDMVDSLVSGDDRNRYYQYLYRSYVEGNRNRKWCPAPGCDLAIEFDAGVYEYYDVICDCSHRFCWKCTEESHRPVDCETVAQWVKKNSSEAENTKWILAYTKPCPECKRAIEKNQGCNHMRCRSPCNFHFCWVCLGPWKEHDNFYACNKFKGEKGDSKDEKIRMNAKKHLELYAHYHERWDSNDKSRKRALDDLNRARNEHIATLNKLQGDTHGQLKFVTEAWEQIVECRRVLKWTYAYGYYLSLESFRNKINFFEYLQGEAEAALERLHHCAETEMDKYLRSPLKDFKDFHSKLAGLTFVTRNYFENLVRALENNLSEVESSGTNTFNS